MFLCCVRSFFLAMIVCTTALLISEERAAKHYTPSIHLVPKDHHYFSHPNGSFYGDQQIVTDGVVFPVAFGNYRDKPQYVKRLADASSNYTMFQVEKSGRYCISWTMTMATSALGVTTPVILNIYNITKQQNVPTGDRLPVVALPTVMQLIQVGADPVSLSGQTTIWLKKGSIFQIVLTASTEEITLSNPQLTIRRVGM